MLFVIAFENIFLLEISKDHHGFVEHNFDFLIAQLDQSRCPSSMEPALRRSTYIFSAFLQLVIDEQRQIFWTALIEIEKMLKIRIDPLFEYLQ
jgi:hypothetical protein